MTGNAATADRAGKAGRLKRALGAALAILIAVPVLFAAGFLWFVWRMPSDEVTLNRSADGIVVLTGGASRILDGIELLAAGRGKRLLISGVHRGTTTGEIARTVPEYARLLACCVDLDHSAVNTLGNAVETRHWVQNRGFRSLIVAKSWGRTNLRLLRAICGIEVEWRGLDKIPRGPLIVAAKHQSVWETFALLPLFADPTFIVKRELMWIPVFGWCMRRADMISVD